MKSVMVSTFNKSTKIHRTFILFLIYSFSVLLLNNYQALKETSNIKDQH